MSTLREAAQQALEALKSHSRIYQRNAAIEALSAALEKQEQGTLCNNTYGCQCTKHFTALRAVLAQQEPLPERELFEHWAQEQRLALNRHAHSYASTATAWCWDAWAARAALAQQEPHDVMAPASAAVVLEGGEA